MRLRTFVIWVVLGLTSCAKHVEVKVPESHGTFNIEPIDKDTVLVSAYGPKGEADAKEYLCTRMYICVREEIPVRVYKITRTRK